MVPWDVKLTAGPTLVAPHPPAMLGQTVCTLSQSPTRA